MSLTSRKSDEKTTKEFHLHTGVFPMKVKFFNPTLQQLNDAGLPFNQEPEYVKEDMFNEGKKQYLATFWLTNLETKAVNEQGEEVKVKEGEIFIPFTFSISEMDHITQDDTKFKYINKYGAGVFAERVEDIPDWFNARESVRVAKRGEEELMQFLFAYANLKSPDRNGEGGDENVLEDPNKLFEDDSELREHVENLIKEGNVVRCLIGLKGRLNEGNINVNETFYRGFYTKHNQKSVIPFKSFIYAEKVKAENREDQKERRSPLNQKIHHFEFNPTVLTVDEAKEKVKVNMDMPDEEEESAILNDAKSKF